MIANRNVNLKKLLIWLNFNVMVVKIMYRI